MTFSTGLLEELRTASGSELTIHKFLRGKDQSPCQWRQHELANILSTAWQRAAIVDLWVWSQWMRKIKAFQKDGLRQRRVCQRCYSVDAGTMSACRTRDQLWNWKKNLSSHAAGAGDCSRLFCRASQCTVKLQAGAYSGFQVRGEAWSERVWETKSSRSWSIFAYKSIIFLRLSITKKFFFSEQIQTVFSFRFFCLFLFLLSPLFSFFSFPLHLLDSFSPFAVLSLSFPSFRLK